MSYVPAARKKDGVAYSAASQGQAVGHAAGLLISELFIPKNPKELYKLIPFLKFTKLIEAANALKLMRLPVQFPVAKLKLLQSSNLLDKAKGAAYVYGYRGASALHEELADYAIEKAKDLTIGAIADLGGFAGALVTLTGAPIADGSNNVFIDKREAARVDDPVEGYQPIAEGSELVTINKKPAARYGDRTRDNGTIIEGSLDCFMGGEPVSQVEIKDRSLGWVSDILDAGARGLAKALHPDKRIKKLSTWVRRGVTDVADAEKKMAKKKLEDAANDAVQSQLKKALGVE